jgi:hypothetical protein
VRKRRADRVAVLLCSSGVDVTSEVAYLHDVVELIGDE